MHFFPEARSTYVSARHGLERARTYAEAAAVAVGNGTGHMRAHAPSGRRSSRELQERAAATYPSLSLLQSCRCQLCLELAPMHACVGVCPDWLQESPPSL